MRVPNLQEDRKRLVEQAMLAKAPALHDRLKASRELDAVLEERAALMDEVMEELGHRAAEEAATSKLPVMERIARHNHALSAAAEIAIAQATEFPIE